MIFSLVRNIRFLGVIDLSLKMFEQNRSIEKKTNFLSIFVESTGYVFTLDDFVLLSASLQFSTGSFNIYFHFILFSFVSKKLLFIQI